MIEDEQNTSNYYLDPFGYLNNSQQYPYFGVESISQNMLIENLQSSQRQQNNLEQQYSITNKSKQITNQSKIKQKMKIKRQKAKTKYFSNNQSKSSDSISNKLKYIQHNNTNIKQQEIRRKKRASAQMSRDKKKQYIKQIQKQNQDLKLRCRQLELENQQLKKSQKQQKSYFNFDFDFDFDFGFDWNLLSEFKRSIKSWFIMGLILFSIQRQSQQDTFTTVINEKYNNNYFENINTNIHSIISQYKKSPIQQRVIHLNYFKQFNDLNLENGEQQLIMTKNNQIYLDNQHYNSMIWDQCLKHQPTFQKE